MKLEILEKNGVISQCFFKNQNKEDPTENFGWDYILS